MRIAVLSATLSAVCSLSAVCPDAGAWPRRTMTRYVGSYDAAMQVPVSYDFMGGASDASLSRADIVAPLTRALPRFVRCVSDEQRRHAALDAVQLHVVVGPDGRVMGATVDQGTPAFQRCALGVVRSLRWRAFSAPRLGFTWGFTVQ